ncbi:hypothetical protein Asi03nite_24130 [Actinoplanes siamensis]|uniref:Uncharacterized protein n=1 Tax=Actinoplanes siamensis TaxID=1223317 RepID=A0A919N5R3_9ACTN|nr:hypothetical protein Asi03nite_24130 [Actinoplanes siamensis]
MSAAPGQSLFSNPGRSSRSPSPGSSPAGSAPADAPAAGAASAHASSTPAGAAPYPAASADDVAGEIADEFGGAPDAIDFEKEVRSRRLPRLHPTPGDTPGGRPPLRGRSPEASHKPPPMLAP